MWNGFKICLWSFVFCLQLPTFFFLLCLSRSQFQLWSVKLHHDIIFKVFIVMCAVKKQWYETKLCRKCIIFYMGCDLDSKFFPLCVVCFCQMYHLRWTATTACSPSSPSPHQTACRRPATLATSPHATRLSIARMTCLTACGGYMVGNVSMSKCFSKKHERISQPK